MRIGEGGSVPSLICKEDMNPSDENVFIVNQFHFDSMWDPPVNDDSKDIYLVNIGSLIFKSC